MQLQVDALKAQLASALDDLENAEKKAAARNVVEKSVRKELIGLSGELRRVAIVIDTSGSMTLENRWAQASSIVNTWIDHLNVDECVLVAFASNVRVFPEDGSFLDVRASAVGDENRAKLTSYLKSVKPGGWTDTLAALQKAYSYPDIDTIVLFTDGKPSDPKNSGAFSKQIADAIYSRCEQHKHIPINTVGIGNYFEPALATFLQKVSSITGGTFVGR